MQTTPAYITYCCIPVSLRLIPPAPFWPSPFLWKPPELNKNPPEGVSVGLTDDDNMFIWALLIVGPPDTVSEAFFPSGGIRVAVEPGVCG